MLYFAQILRSRDSEVGYAECVAGAIPGGTHPNERTKVRWLGPSSSLQSTEKCGGLGGDLSLKLSQVSG